MKKIKMSDTVNEKINRKISYLRAEINKHDFIFKMLDDRLEKAILLVFKNEIINVRIRVKYIVSHKIWNIENWGMKLIPFNEEDIKKIIDYLIVLNERIHSSLDICKKIQEMDKNEKDFRTNRSEFKFLRERCIAEYFNGPIIILFIKWEEVSRTLFALRYWGTFETNEETGRTFWVKQSLSGKNRHFHGENQYFNTFEELNKILIKIKSEIIKYDDSYKKIFLQNELYVAEKYLYTFKNLLSETFDDSTIKEQNLIIDTLHIICQLTSLKI